jgi:hypothetical protein
MLWGPFWLVINPHVPGGDGGGAGGAETPILPPRLLSRLVQGARRGGRRETHSQDELPTPSRVPGFSLTVTHNLHRNLPSRAHLSPGASRNPAFQVGSHTWQRLKPKTHYYCLLPKPPHRLPNPFQTNTPAYGFPYPLICAFFPWAGGLPPRPVQWVSGQARVPDSKGSSAGRISYERGRAAPHLKRSFGLKPGGEGSGPRGGSSDLDPPAEPSPRPPKGSSL